MAKRCIECRFAQPSAEGYDIQRELLESQGDMSNTHLICAWEPPGGLPYAWRWCRREVVSVSGEEGDDCSQFIRRALSPEERALIYPEQKED